ncbi:MAG: hypothetical protein KBT12_00630 [Bacteroidales bacterium]|nr:hypothetical protein [Candidatus Physcousia equi]
MASDGRHEQRSRRGETDGGAGKAPCLSFLLIFCKFFSGQLFLLGEVKISLAETKNFCSRNWRFLLQKPKVSAAETFLSCSNRYLGWLRVALRDGKEKGGAAWEHRALRL